VIGIDTTDPEMTTETETEIATDVEEEMRGMAHSVGKGEMTRRG
jgi:hypothetical protein